MGSQQCNMQVVVVTVAVILVAADVSWLRAAA